MSNIAERLIAIRGPKSRRSFADELGVKESTLRNYEQGVTQPTADFLENICKILRISPHWLLLGTGSMNDTPPAEPHASYEEIQALRQRVIELEFEREGLRRQKQALKEENRLILEARISRDKDVEHYRDIIDGLLAHLRSLAPGSGD